MGILQGKALEGSCKEPSLEYSHSLECSHTYKHVFGAIGIILRNSIHPWMSPDITSNLLTVEVYHP